MTIETEYQLREIVADDLRAFSLHGRLWVAWSGASLDRQSSQVGVLGTDSGTIDIQLEIPHSFRPALAPAPGDHPALLACRCTSTGDRFEPVFCNLGEQGPDPELRVLPAGDNVHQVTLAPSRDGYWTAWTEGGGARTRIRVGYVGLSGSFQSICHVEGRDPALASADGECRLAWVDGEGIWVAAVEPGGLTERKLVVAEGPDRMLGAPALAHAPGRGWHLAWHGAVGDGVLRWIHLAREGPRGWETIGAAPGAAEGSEARGEDQGWEFPAILCDSRGSVWLAGRSSLGFHVQGLSDERGTWTERLDLSTPGWSGRSRTCALVEADDRVIFVRGTPGGLRSSALTSDAGDGRQAGEAQSRTARTAPPSRTPGVLFGDLHQHSIISDGLGGVDDAYRRARRVYGHDLAALTDHEKLGPRALGPLSWRHQCQVADAHYVPGEFVTLRAYEFTGPRLPGPGHKCIYFGERVPDRLPEKEVEPLLEMLRAYDAIAVPHHVAWTGADLEHHDPALQPVWEICSVHGAYEHGGEQPIPPREDVVLEGQFIQDALEAGLRFGFIGGTDSHGLRWHHGVCWRADPFRTGLAAVFSEPTREGVLAALRARRCYATSGARILLRVSIEGAEMGSEIQHPGSPVVEVEASGTAPIERLSIILDGNEVHRTQGGPSLTCFHRLQPTRPASYCYVRLLQRDGEMAWSSPIWIDLS